MTVLFTGAFESGQVNSTSNAVDGWLVQTLLGTAYYQITSGGLAPNSGYDTRVVASETRNGETLLPRKGSHFMRSEIYFGKDYSIMPFNSGKNKARSSITINGTSFRVPYDQEKYLGFSIRIPNDYKHETGVRDERGACQLLTVYPGTDTKATFFMLSVYVKSPNTVSHWYLQIHTDAASITESTGALTEYDLGPVTGDIGKWTDFVIRYRANPFTVDTNPSGTIAGSKNQTFQGNKGIFQCWKGTGAVDGQGNRTMALVGPNIVDAPVGLVPKATDEFVHSLRIYKWGWHTSPTVSTSPVWFGFDEARIGDTFAEVAPSGLPLESGGAELTSVNSGAAIDPGAEELDFVGTDLNIPISGFITDGTHTQNLPWVVPNATGTAGGKLSVGDLSNITDPNISVVLNLKAANTFTTDFASWTTLFARKSGTAPAVWTFNDGVTVAGGTTAGGATYTHSCIESPNEAITAGDIITVRWIVKLGTTTKIDVRVVSGSEYLEVKGYPGSLSLSQSGIGTNVSFSDELLSDTGAYLITLTFTASASVNIKKRVSIGVATTDLTVHALYCASFINEAATATQVAFATTANLPDLTAPTLSGLTFSSVSGTSGTITVTTDEFVGDGWAVVTNNATAPTQEQVRTGLDHTGAVAMWGGYAAVTGATITWSPTGLTKASNKYAHVYHVDGAGNESSVVTSTVIAADTTVKKFVWSEFNGNAIYCFVNGVGLVPFTGDMEVKITKNDYFGHQSAAQEIAYAPVVSFVNGEGFLDESKLTSGSIESEQVGNHGYNFWATDGTYRVDNTITLIAE